MIEINTSRQLFDVCAQLIRTEQFYLFDSQFCLRNISHKGFFSFESLNYFNQAWQLF